MELTRRPTAHHRMTAEAVRSSIAHKIGSNHGLGDPFRLDGVEIVGSLDLSYLDLPFPLELVDCVLDDDLRLESGHFRALRLEHCWCRSVWARNLEVAGDLALVRGCRVEGELQLTSARIGGSFQATSSVLHNPGRKCLQAKGSTVGSDVLLFASCLDGEAKLANAEIRGDVILANSLMVSPGYTLNLNGARVGGSLLAERTGVYPPNLLHGRHAWAEWVEPADHDQAEVGLFSSRGTFYLDHARIGADLVLTHGRFHRPDASAIEARGIEVGGDVYLHRDFEARGTVELRGSRIGGDLNADRGRFHAPSEGPHARQALLGFGLQVGGSVTFGDGQADDPTTPRSRVVGRLSFEGAQVAKNFWCRQIVFAATDHPDDAGPAGDNGLDLSNAEIAGRLHWQVVTSNPQTILRLSYCRVGHLVDDLGDMGGTSLAAGNLFLDGFDYKKLGRGQDRLEDRLAWLQLQPLHPDQHGERAERLVWSSSYERLARYYRSVGLPREAKVILYEKERTFLEGLKRQWKERWKRRLATLRGWLRRETSTTTPSTTAPSATTPTTRATTADRRRHRFGLSLEIAQRLFFDRTVGYGYRFHRLLGFFLVFLVAGALLFAEADRRQLVRRIGEPISGGAAVRQVPDFNPLLYSLDTLVPVFDLHQDGHWTLESPGAGRHPLALGLRSYLIVHIFVGWIMTSLILSGILGVFKDEA